METFKDRLLILINRDAKGKPTVFAKKAGIPTGTFHRYVTTEGFPKLEHIIRIAECSNVTLDWLLVGEGPMEKGAAPEFETAPDLDLMREVIQEIAELFDETDLHLPPDKYAQLVILYYKDRSKDRDSKPDRGRLIELVRLAS